MPENKPVDKAELLKFLIEQVEQKLRDAVNNYEQAKESVHGEDKSSAGDKHETSRAMAQIEWEKAAKVVSEQQKILDTLLRIEKIKAIPTQAALGTLLICEDACFLLSVGLGAVCYQGQTVYVIGLTAPLGQQLLGKKTGDSFLFNGKTLTIKKLA